MCKRLKLKTYYNDSVVEMWEKRTVEILITLWIRPDEDNPVSHKFSLENINRLEFHHLHVACGLNIVKSSCCGRNVISECFIFLGEMYFAYTSLQHSLTTNSKRNLECYWWSHFQRKNGKQKQQLRHLFTNIAAIEIRNANSICQCVIK